MTRQNHQTKAFTLAEVLITLAIIGIVAALTIPMLMNNISDKESKTAWKETYSMLSQATLRIMQDNDETMKGLCVGMDYQCIADLYEAYLSTTKTCDSSTFYGTCWSNSFTSLSGSSPGWGAGSGALLKNGSFAGFYYYAPNCDFSYIGTQLCGEIIVDVNGFKRPNVIGRDIFLVKITDKGISPDGINDGTTNSCDPTSDGRGCSAKYLYDK